MSGVGFLLIVVVVSVLGSIIVWLRNRQPRSSMSSVGDFQREMEALGSQPPVVSGGQVENHQRHRVNTVQIRPNEPEAVVDPEPPSGDAGRESDAQDAGDADGIGTR